MFLEIFLIYFSISLAKLFLLVTVIFLNLFQLFLTLSEMAISPIQATIIQKDLIDLLLLLQTLSAPQLRALCQFVQHYVLQGKDNYFS